ncbi:hypothetical protein OGH69_13835 [Flavobacterium sp. MFBS3-15]|uniref:hypothetical protein n=1 Tax=Flavobacterium sp. MFBS3-15 TaxID=2989816 RepID=UPI002235DA92|nr:hypothetical protein [Flavobacterium sp. MFBS3-15]MCW4470052.1 hypothetical protein [Flavobacterium sp. MFBS3-15]
MKIITPIVSAVIAFAALPLAAAAQEYEGLRNQEGFEVSHMTGVLSKLTRWQNKLPATPVFHNPQEKMLAQLGIRQPVMATMDTSYEFYGGLTTKGNDVPLASVTDAEEILTSRVGAVTVSILGATILLLK